jgi:hypothetical protein
MHPHWAVAQLSSMVVSSSCRHAAHLLSRLEPCSAPWQQPAAVADQAQQQVNVLEIQPLQVGLGQRLAAPASPAVAAWQPGLSLLMRKRAQLLTMGGREGQGRVCFMSRWSQGCRLWC